MADVASILEIASSPILKKKKTFRPGTFSSLHGLCPTISLSTVPHILNISPKDPPSPSRREADNHKPHSHKTTHPSLKNQTKKATYPFSHKCLAQTPRGRVMQSFLASAPNHPITSQILSSTLTRYLLTPLTSSSMKILVTPKRS